MLSHISYCISHISYLISHISYLISHISFLYLLSSYSVLYIRNNEPTNSLVKCLSLFICTPCRWGSFLILSAFHLDCSGSSTTDILARKDLQVEIPTRWHPYKYYKYYRYYKLTILQAAVNGGTWFSETVEYLYTLHCVDD